jgi:hypothetical protein
MVRVAYDVQEQRIATGLRVVAQFTSRFENLKSTDPNEDPDAVDREREKMLKLITQSYARVTDGIAATARKKLYKFDDILTDETELFFVENYLDMLEQEKKAFDRLAKALKKFSFYDEYLSNVRGIGPAMAGVLISELDPYKAKYPSSFWKYAGLDVVHVVDKETKQERDEGRSRREAHLVQIEYTDKDGETKTRRGISYNPWLKSKLLAVLAPSFLRAGNERYVTVYQDYKTRMLNRPDLQGNVAIKAISHKRALRYMIKIFLIDLHMAWRAHEGLQVSVPYHEAKLGLTHGRDPSVEEILAKREVTPVSKIEPEPPLEVTPVRKPRTKTTVSETSERKKTRTRKADVFEASIHEVAKNAPNIPKRGRPKGMG